jgi:hypothetical protein
MAKQKERIPAKMCFSHIGGKLGMLLMESFLDKGWLAKSKHTANHLLISISSVKNFVFVQRPPFGEVR